jgi:hypothetical protein
VKSDRFVLPTVAFPKLESVVETYYLADREKPDEYFGSTELASFSEQQSGPNKVKRNEISGCVYLLKQIGILEKGEKRKYRLNELGKKLGSSIKDQLKNQENLVWSKVVLNCSFLVEIYRHVEEVKSIGQDELEKDIVYSCGRKGHSPSALIGALTLLDILEQGGYIIKKEKDRRNKTIVVNSNSASTPYISNEIISSLRTIESKYDLSKLIRLCEEINDCYNRKNYYAVGILNRAILDHVPPIFGCDNFSKVANNYTSVSRSFREHMQKLDGPTHKIADDYVHGQIKAKENAANSIQVNFSSSFDVLLQEIIKILS